MLTMPVVERCPYTVAGTGAIKIPANVIATLAGAVVDDDEWIALMIGKRSANGLEIQIDSLRIPLQERGPASCSLVNKEPLSPEIVGVIHLHPNGMRAFFSATDDNTLNTRFPVSLVIANTRHNSSDVERLLGFDYLAEGRVMLPCSSVGVVGFRVVPEPSIEGWPEDVVSGFGSPNESITLHNCPHTSKSTDGMNQLCSTKCGVVITEKATAIFGRDGTEFLAEVRKQTKHSNKHHYMISDNRYWLTGKKDKHSRWDDDERFLRHWGEYGAYGGD